MQQTEIRFSKKAQRFYVYLLNLLALAASIPIYFTDALLIIVLPMNLFMQIFFIFCSINNYKRPVLILTDAFLEMANKRKNNILNWKDITKYYITVKGKKNILTIVSTEKTVTLNLWGLEKSPEEIMKLLNTYKYR